MDPDVAEAVERWIFDRYRGMGLITTGGDIRATQADPGPTSHGPGSDYQTQEG